MKIECKTLFDITRTDVHSRRHKLDSQDKNTEMIKRREQQSNLNTIIQIISMRSQPEEITDPEKIMIQLTQEWGNEYRNKTKIPAWVFTFEISQDQVFNNGIDSLGHLMADCEGVPMIVGLDEWKKIKEKLTVSEEYKNITFKLIS